jgi:hypothetical protein
MSTSGRDVVARDTREGVVGGKRVCTSKQTERSEPADERGLGRSLKALLLFCFTRRPRGENFLMLNELFV